VLPIAIGASLDPARIMMDSFGLVAMVAMTPLIALQLMGILYKSKMQYAKDLEDVSSESDDEIVEFEEALDDE
jgi:hypothetical protein